MLALDFPVGFGIVLAAIMFLIYIPLGYVTDRAVHRFRQRKRKT